MARIAETADLIDTPAGQYLLVPADAGLVDTLAAFAAESEDREPDLEDEPDEGKEDDRDNDNAIDVAHGAFGFMPIEDLEPEDHI
jgi:hypothetical protein